MRCEEARRLLEEYNGVMPDGREGEVLAEHIYSCSACRAEYGELLKYRSAMDSLPRVSAPEDFLRQVRGRLPERKTGAWNRLAEMLFLPLNRKLPLEAAGALAVAVIAIVLYNPLEYMKKDVPLYMEQEEKPDISESELKISSAPAPEKEKRISAKKDRLSFRSAKSRRTGTAVKQKVSVPEYELSMTISSSKPEYPARAAADDEMASSRKEYAAEKSRAVKKTGGAEGKAASPVVADGATRDIHSGSIEEVRNLISVLDGSLEHEHRNPGTGRPEKITVLIPARNYLNFVYQLGNIGVIRDSSRRPVADAGTVRVTISFRYRD